MTFRKSLKYLMPLLLLGFAAKQEARAATVPLTGTFSADDSTFSLLFSTATAQSYTFKTTSYATGGFVPVLTLFNSTSGAAIDNNGSAIGDAMLTDTLSAGSYVLYLTEFPNVAINNLSDGFLFSGFPTITGDTCTGFNGKSFVDTITCSQRTGNYSLTATSNSPVPEPATWLLVLTPAAFLLASRRFTA